MKERIFFKMLSLTAIVIWANMHLIVGAGLAIAFLIVGEVLNHTDDKIIAVEWEKIRARRDEIEQLERLIARDERFKKFMEEW